MNKFSVSDPVSARCKICGLPEEAPFMEIESRYADVRTRSYKNYQCRNCGLIYVYPDPEEADLEALYSGDDYLDFLFDNPGWRTWVQEKHWLPVLREIENRKGRGVILDVGCSDGLFMDFAGGRGWDVFGIDVNGEMLSLAGRKHGDHVQSGSAYEPGWPEGHFDVVRLCHVLEHLNAPAVALGSLYRVLKPGGILSVGVPIFDDRVFNMFKKLPASKLRKDLVRLLAWMDPPHHLTTWSTRSLGNALEKTGFEIISKSYRSDIFPMIAKLRTRSLFFRVAGIYLRIVGSGVFIEVLARKPVSK